LNILHGKNGQPAIGGLARPMSMGTPSYKAITAEDEPNLLETAFTITSSSWPEFMRHDPISVKLWRFLYRDFPEYQFILVDVKTDKPAAVGNSLPLAWKGSPGSLPDSGWDWALVRGFKDRRAGKQPKVSCALAIAVAPGFRNRGISRHVIMTMKSIAVATGLRALIAPVRPTHKSHYPLISMERYINWKNDDGRPFDPWMRVHADLGAEIVKVCPRSMRISGTIDEWAHWCPYKSAVAPAGAFTWSQMCGCSIG
jgi:ribosomal protein S18 acetylase RimI-like enzyme